jgi:hypothetical protein
MNIFVFFTGDTKVGFPKDLKNHAIFHIYLQRFIQETFFLYIQEKKNTKTKVQRIYND